MSHNDSKTAPKLFSRKGSIYPIRNKSFIVSHAIRIKLATKVGLKASIFVFTNNNIFLLYGFG